MHICPPRCDGLSMQGKLFSRGSRHVRVPAPVIFIFFSGFEFVGLL